MLDFLELFRKLVEKVVRPLVTSVEETLKIGFYDCR